MSLFRNYQNKCGRMNCFHQMLLYSVCLFWILEDTEGYSASALKRSVRSMCRIFGLKITNCDKEISRYANSRMTVTYQQTCNLKDVVFEFVFGKDGEYSSSIKTTDPVMTVFAMRKKLNETQIVFSPGTNYISVTIKAKTFKDEPLSASSEKCKFYVRHENATASLGEINRVVKSKTNFFVDARRSRNNDVEKKNKDLVYRWKCDDTGDYCEDFEDLGTASRLLIPADYAINGVVFNFTVEVKSLPTYWQSATQFVTVDDKHHYSIYCVESCGKYPNTLSPNEFPVLLNRCGYSCSEDETKPIHGVMIYENGGMKFWDNFVNAYRLMVHLPAGTKVTCKAHYDDDLKYGNVLAKQVFTVLGYPELDKCKVVPPKGTSLTKFKVECEYKEETRKHFEIQVISDDTVLFSTTSSKLEDIEFLVSSEDAIVTVKLEDIHDVYSERNLTVEIEPLAAEQLDDIYEGKAEGTRSVSELIESGDLKQAVQIIGVVAKGITTKKIASEEEKKMVNDKKTTILNDLAKLHIEDIDLSKSVSGVLKILATKQDNVSDSDMAKILTKSCKEVAKQQLHLQQNDMKEAISANEMIDITRNLMSCGESETSPYYDIFNETAMDIEITTRYPINPNLSRNFEDYPQYDADDEEKANDFLMASENMLDICRDMGDSLAHSFPSKMPEPTYIVRETSIVSVMRAPGSKLADATFHQHSVILKPSPDVGQYLTILSLRVCSYKNDPFWSISKDYKIPTNVIDVKIYDETNEKRITSFKNEPMNISFDVSEGIVKKKLSRGKLRIPDESSKFKEDQFAIFMIKAKAEESFFVDFLNLGDTQLEVVIISMKRPRLNDFLQPIRINQTTEKYFVSHKEKADKWFMLGIKPGNDMVYLTTTPETIHCQCMHLSTLAGAFDYNELKSYPKFIHLDFELEEARSFFIITCVCVLVGLYCILLMYSVQKNETLEDAVYLMADVPAENRFAYLVIVYTGGRIGAGTSSEVVVKLFGAEACSQEHVVNFPDPMMELLQRTQEDYFVLASPVYLGKLEKIQVWYDCTGTSPNWYCNRIRVCDMQTKKWSSFMVNKWFKVEGKPMIFTSILASSDKEDVKEYNKKKSRLLRSFLSFGRFDKTIWQLSTRTSNPSFSYLKRLTLILSVIITMMSVTLAFYGKPEFKPRDSITKKCYFEMRPSLLYVGLYSALITFFPHLVIMEGIKNARTEFHSKLSRDTKALPAACNVFFWLVLITNITVHIHLLLTYGSRFVVPTTWEWMLSFSFGFFLYVFFLDYVYNIFVILVGGAVSPVRINFEKVIRNIEEQRRVLYKFVGRYIYRPILGPLYETMTQTEFMKKRIHFRQKREMVYQVQDLFMIGTFMLLLYIIVLGEIDAIYDFRGHEQVMKLVNGPPSQALKLTEVNNITGFEEFMEKGFIPTMQSYQWYGRYVSENPGMTTDACNKYLGVFRLRQHREKQDSCNATKEMDFLNRTCRSADYFFPYDYMNYTPSWNTTIAEVHRSRMGYVWGHQTGVGQIFVGLTGFYRSGGYVANLGRTIENSYVNFNYLKRYSWLDSLTKAVIMEFCLYNVNKNLFHFVQVVLEKTPAGFISKDVTTKTERVMKHSSKSQNIALICSLVFMVLILAMCMRTVLRIIKTKVWFKRDLWHIVDVVLVLLCFTWIGLYAKRLKVVQEFVKSLEESSSNSFVDYFPILSIESWMRSLAGMLICISTIRMWKVVRFGVIFRTVERTLLFSMQSLCMMMLCYMICVIAFGETFYVTLGSRVEQFKDEYFVLRTLISITIGVDRTKPDEVCLNERGLGYAFSIIYSVFCHFLSATFVAIIIFSYEEARQFSFEEKIDYSVKDYTKETMEGLKRNARFLAKKFRLSAGNSKPIVEEEMVTPKEDNLRYKNCVQTDSNRMKAMASVAKCVLLKIKRGLRFDDSDFALMMRTVRNLCNEEEGEKEIFFKEDIKESGLHLVDDRRILMMEKVVKRMLETPEMRAKREEMENAEKTMWADNLARMMKMNDQLKLMSRAVNNIEITMPSSR